MTLDEKTTPTDATRASSRDVNQKPQLKHSQSTHYSTANVTLSAPSVASHVSDDITWRLHLRSSDCFEKIMTDIEGKMVEQVKKQQLEVSSSQVTNQEETGVVEKKHILLDFEEDDDELDKDRLEPYNSPSRIKARRAWAIIRRHIREQAMNKQTSSSLQWSMLKQTLKNMTNMDAAREELYKKYLDPDKPRNWTDGMKSIPQGFFARHSKVVIKRPIDKSPPASIVAKKSSKARSSAYRR